MQEIFIRENGSICVRTVNEEPSLTDQQFKDETDVNKILMKYIKNGLQIPPLTGQYLDLTQLPDFREAQDIVLRGQEAFMSLDAHLRARFNNDPAQMLQFLDDPANAEEAVKLGLISKQDMAARNATNNATDAKNEATDARTNAPNQDPSSTLGGS